MKARIVIMGYKRVPLAFGLLVFALASVTTSSEELSINEWLSKAEESFARGNYEETLSILEEALAVYPEDEKLLGFKQTLKEVKAMEEGTPVKEESPSPPDFFNEKKEEISDKDQLIRRGRYVFDFSFSPGIMTSLEEPTIILPLFSIGASFHPGFFNNTIGLKAGYVFNPFSFKTETILYQSFEFALSTRFYLSEKRVSPIIFYLNAGAGGQKYSTLFFPGSFRFMIYGKIGFEGSFLYDIFGVDLLDSLLFDIHAHIKADPQDDVNMLILSAGGGIGWKFPEIIVGVTYDYNQTSLLQDDIFFSKARHTVKLLLTFYTIPP